MKPALYYPWIYLRGGAERLILELVRRSQAGWTIYTNHYEPERTFGNFADLNVVPMRHIPVRRSLASVTRGLATLATQTAHLRGHDALIVVSEGLGNFFATRERTPRSCICLTPLKVTYDATTRRTFFAGQQRRYYRPA